MRTMKELAAEAIAIQDACNMRGLSKAFPKIVEEVAEHLAKEGKGDSDSIARHPVVRLWASKLHDLAGMGLDDKPYGEAYFKCREWSD